ncbi:3-hydroxybenzoate 6-hydroxylase [Corynascus novoguineensis]|uniref:3-hydroxybenzoate 6-hydroxylase n=1 Tax=Corynascus novoguineensis TaxID=1126955 RepID=A0AAN7CUR5_9PEZI|nr:3-hydroxybenzoate 6-hydroxylase [Corynascus novoguineensis]
MSASVEHPGHHGPPTFGRAGVVGAGIAGLAAAIALRRAGWDVEVFERSQFKNEIGAAITVTPNAAMVLRRWGFDMEKAMAMLNQSMILRLAADPSVILDQQEYPDGDGVLKYGVWSFHRVDLHRGLRDLATATANSVVSGTPVQIRLGCKIEGIDCEAGVLHVSDSRTIHKDLLVLADGAHSDLISKFTGHPCEARRNNKSIYRWLVPMDVVLAEADMGQFYHRERSGFVGWLDPDTQALLVTYTCRGGKVLNIALVHDTQPGRAKEKEWHSQVSTKEVLATATNFHPSLKKIVSMPTEDGINVHHVVTRSPLSSFVRGRTVVVGDAAHVMMPSHAAGAGIAIESAASLEVLFRRVNGKDDPTVRHRLGLFDKLRVPRCNLTLLVSNSHMGRLQEPGVVDEIRKFYRGPLPTPGALPYSKPWMDVLFNHDEFWAAEELLTEEGVKAEDQTA